MKVAIVHDFLVSFGGAERVLQSFCRLYPDAPIYTLLSDPEIVRKYFPGREVRTSFLQRLPGFLRRRYRWLLPFFPVAVEAFDLRDFDLVISSSGAWSKGVVTRLRTRHIAYLHSPMRYLWDANETYLARARSRACVKFFGRFVLSYLRLWDREASLRPDVLVSNSAYTKARASKYYRRGSDVIYPAVSLRRNKGFSSRGKFFLIVARLSESKGIDVAVEAFNKLGLPLQVVGAGKELRHLRSIAAKNISFPGFVPDTMLAGLYTSARAVIVPSEEDFGLAAAEALAAGTPAIAFGRGGAREIIEEGVTGEFFLADTPEVLADAVRRFLSKEASYSREACRESVERFSEERFLTEWRRIIADTMAKK
jgi:glycosyltransferase involved in cell wall biosynthesis